MRYHHLEQFIDATGRVIAWLALAMVAVMFAVVVLRFVFELGWVWLQETVNYLHAYIFMLGAAYTLRHDGHVRVDVFYRNMPTRRRAWIDLGGTLLLLMPVTLFILVTSWDPVIESWRSLEPSQRTGGLPFAYILKTCMLIMPVLLFVQGVAIVWRQTLVLTGKLTVEPPSHG